LCEVELGFAVSRKAGPRADPRMGLAVFDGPARLVLAPFGCLPTPEPEKVVIIALQKVQMRVVVEDGRRVLVFGADQPNSTVLHIPPGVGPCKVSRLAGPVRKISWVGNQDA
jgi:hypothetical protein